MADPCSLSLLTIMDRLWFHQMILFPSDSTPLQPLTSTTPHHETSTIEKEEEGATGMNPSHSPSTDQGRPKNIKQSSSMRELDGKYSMISCRSFRELEMEEVKGFIDLGFEFNKQNTNPRTARLIPGLLKFLDSNFKEFDDDDQEHEKEKDHYEEEEEEEKGITRPYLSEAWLVNRRNLQLLNLNLPLGGVSTSDMKNYLKFWARNVACVIHQQ